MKKLVSDMQILVKMILLSILFTYKRPRVIKVTPVTMVSVNCMSPVTCYHFVYTLAVSCNSITFINSASNKHSKLL